MSAEETKPEEPVVYDTLGHTTRANAPAAPAVPEASPEELVLTAAAEQALRDAYAEEHDLVDGDNALLRVLEGATRDGIGLARAERDALTKGQDDA